ncbi:hypothetical protein NYP18_09195 [Corynebacterium sp. YIM 101645]|uniref:Type II toxin-antitoxin system PemK/MazF family toxin n=1 Tax=Corynebacterium lemuris TaxID=1859292 RepID=A0ABT2FX66_9CORY|nr:hypothetical protein [Corynebacterium lemuris]MCS5479834.1 hypothetical protein [Corynebacterium lemuris]
MRDRLRKALPGHGDMIAAELPDGWNRRKTPIVVVAPDGPQRSVPGNDTELVRVTARAPDLPRARRMMTHIDGYLTTPGQGFLGFSISPATRLTAGPDSLVGGSFASCVYRVATHRKVKSHGTEA